MLTIYHMIALHIAHEIICKDFLQGYQQLGTGQAVALKNRMINAINNAMDCKNVKKGITIYGIDFSRGY